MTKDHSADRAKQACSIIASFPTDEYTSKEIHWLIKQAAWGLGNSVEKSFDLEKEFRKRVVAELATVAVPNPSILVASLMESFHNTGMSYSEAAKYTAEVINIFEPILAAQTSQIALASQAKVNPDGEDLILRPNAESNSSNNEREFFLQLRSHKSLGETNYQTVAYVSREVAYRIADASKASFCLVTHVKRKTKMVDMNNMQCLGCNNSITKKRWDSAEGVCVECERKLRMGEKVPNSGGDPYAGRGLRNDPFVL